MEAIEIEAEVFRVIRANSDKQPAYILRQVKAQLPDVSDRQISEAIQRLIKRG